MVDRISTRRRSANMRAIRSTGTKPEMIVRRLVYGMGYRYLLHRRDLPGCPDMVFWGRRKAIFVHGCFWHQHDDENCKIARTPKSNQEYWFPKLRRNTERDRKNQKLLLEAGWATLVIWECQTEEARSLKERIIRFLGT